MGKKSMKKIFLFSLLFLNACGTYLAQRDGNQCLNYGFQPGSPQYANCRMTLHTRRQDALATIGRNFQQQNLLQQQMLLQQQQQRQQRQQQTLDKSFQCTSYKTGNYVNTNCY